MSEYQFIKLLKDKHVVDSYQFYSACKFKLESASISYTALSKLINEYLENAKNETMDMYKELSENRKFSFISKADNVNYLGQELPRSLVIDKLTIEIFSLLHSFFDTFAQWINSCLFAEKALPLKTVNYHNVIKELDSFPEYSGQFITDLKGLVNEAEFRYIADINNIIKHRYQIYTKSKFNFFDGKGNVTLPKFRKDNNIYSDEEVLQIILSCMNFCDGIFNDSITFIKNYYSDSDNQYTRHRIYNPKSYMLFESEEDYKHLRNVKNSIHYIEVDSANILDEYHIMLVSDDVSNCNMSLYNSIYQVIAIKDKSTENYIGILKPLHTSVYSFDDGRILEYRKYASKIVGYEFELFSEIVNQDFKYLPYLSDCKITVIKEPKDADNLDDNKDVTEEVSGAEPKLCDI